jgi:MFS family permease
MINLPLGIIALIALYLRVPESRDEQAAGQIDVPGALLAALGLAGLTYGFITAPARGFGDLSVGGALAGGVIALAAFVRVEARSDHPMMPLRLFRSRAFSGANLLTLFLYGALNAGTFFLSLNLVQAQGYSLAVAGFAFTPFALILTALSRWAGGLVDRYGPRLPLMIGPSLAGAGFLVMAFSGLTAGPSHYWVTFFPGVVVLGMGMGVTVAPLTTTVMNSVETHQAGTASGVNNAVARTAGVLAIAVVGAIALLLFAGALQARTAPIALSGAARSALASEAAQLGAATAPPQVSPENVQAVQAAIKLAFVDTFRIVMLICTGLSWLSAMMAGLWLRRR